MVNWLSRSISSLYLIYTSPIRAIWDRSLKQIIVAVFGFYDLVTDIEYVVGVPIYSLWILVPMIFTIIGCFVYSVNYAISIRGETRIFELDASDSMFNRGVGYVLTTLIVLTGLWPLLTFKAD